MNLANKLTVLRLLLIPVFMVLFFTMGLTSVVPALVFAVASATDFLDGYIARSRGLVTTFGKFMDPLADKMLTQAAFILLVQSGDIPAWIVVVIVCRELLITGFRTVAVSNGVTIAASKWGKYKTVFQMLTILYCLLHHSLFSGITAPIDTVLIYLALAFTVISAVDYIVKNIQVLDLSNM